MWLSVGDRISFTKPRGYRKRFPFRNRRTQAWNRKRRRCSVQDYSKHPRTGGFYVMSVEAGSSITLI